MGEPTYRHIVVGGAEPHRVYVAKLTGLAPGSEFEYRVLQSGKTGLRRKGPRAPLR